MVSFSETNVVEKGKKSDSADSPINQEPQAKTDMSNSDPDLTINANVSKVSVQPQPQPSTVEPLKLETDTKIQSVIGQKRGKVKLHNRTPSYNKVNTAHRPSLNKSKSTDSVLRVKRNNKSLTKLSNLQPLTKTTLNQSLKSNKSNTSLKNFNVNFGHTGGLKLSAKQGKAIIKLNEDNDDFEDVSDNEGQDSSIAQDPQRSLAGGTTQPPADFNANVPLQQVFQQALEQQNNQAMNHVELSNKLSQPLQQYLQETNGNTNYGQQQEEKDEDEEKEEEEKEKEEKEEDEEKEEEGKSQVQGKPEERHSSSPSPSLAQQSSTHQRETSTEPQESSTAQQESSKDPQESSQKDPSSPQKQASNENNEHSNPHPTISTDDLGNNLYGGSLYLSQSTGLTRKMDSQMRPQEGDIPVGSASSEVNGGISFKAHPMDLNHNIAEPITTNKNAIKENSYQPNQTIFNNLQRTNNQYVNSKRQSNQNDGDSRHMNQPAYGTVKSTLQRNKSQNQQQNQTKVPIAQINGPNNFSNFLNNNTSKNIDNTDTRTQQRLWLQRENSLMDVSVDPSQLANMSSLSLSNLMFANSYHQSGNHFNQPTTPMTPGGNLNMMMTPIGSVPGQSIPGSYQQPRGFTNNNNNNSQTSLHANNDTLSQINNVNGLYFMLQNGQQNPIQSRIEFERLNREYLNVRRYLNPVGESLNRTKNNTIVIKKSTQSRENNQELSIQNMNANNFKEFSPKFHEKEADISTKINKIWQDALVLTLSFNESGNSSDNKPESQSLTNGSSAYTQSNYSSDNNYTNTDGNSYNPNTTNTNTNVKFSNSPKQYQRPQIQRLPSKNQYANLRNPQTPTTRAVKLAAQAQGRAT